LKTEINSVWVGAAFLALPIMIFGAETGIDSTPLWKAQFKGDFAVAGAYTRQFGVATPQTNPFVLTLNNAQIPNGSTIKKAFAVWNYLSNAPGSPEEQAIKFNGTDVIGDVLGTADRDLVWNRTHAISFIADVTTLVTGAGFYTIRDAVDEAATGSLGEGFSLYVAYANAAKPMRQFYAWGGYTSTRDDGSGILNFTDQTYRGGEARLFLNALDGQDIFGDKFEINGQDASTRPPSGVAGNAWKGMLGPDPLGANLYDHLDTDAQAFMNAGQDFLEFNTTGYSNGALPFNDAIGHSFAAMSFAVPEPATLVALSAAVGFAIRRRARSQKGSN
jgi:hypothetical protein